MLLFVCCVVLSVVFLCVVLCYVLFFCTLSDVFVVCYVFLGVVFCVLC